MLPLVAWLVVIGLLIGGLAYCSQRAEAQVRIDCPSFANVIGYFADLRDVRGDVELAVAMGRERNPDMGEREREVLEREIRRLWREGLSRDEAMSALYKRCQQQLGDMGVGT